MPAPEPNAHVPCPAHPEEPPESGGILRVGQLAERSGKTVRAIRFYEELGLLSPLQRTKGGFREYDESALLRIRWIDRLQELGFSLSDIREFLGQLRGAESGPAAMEQLRVFYAQKLLDTRAQIERLVSLEKELSESLSYLSACRACAPHTHRSACRSCGEPDHRENPAPVLVAAVHEPDPQAPRGNP